MRLLLATLALVSALAALAFLRLGNWLGNASDAALAASSRRAGLREAA